MEWNPGTGQQPEHKPAHAGTHRAKRSMLNLRVISVVLLFGIAILIAALAGFVAIGGPTSEGKYVNKKQMQAVFLNGGQVYFGHINSLNDKFMRVGDIYYLRVNQTVQPNGNTNNQDISLVKLGCELHGPEDQMVINQSQVIFWENLKSDGQVAKAVAQYKQQNPNGQNCSTSSSNSSSSSSSSSDNSSSSSNSSSNSSTTGTGTGSTSNSTKKP